MVERKLQNTVLNSLYFSDKLNRTSKHMEPRLSVFNVCSYKKKKGHVQTSCYFFSTNTEAKFPKL